MATVDYHDPRLNGLNIKNWDSPIYRIFRLDRLRELIQTQRNCLVETRKWDDPFENFFLKQKVKMPTGELGSLATIHDGWLGQCWTMHKDTDAMWRIYSPAKSISPSTECCPSKHSPYCYDGVRVSTTAAKLFDNFYDRNDDYSRLKFFIGAVEYKTKAEIQDFLKNTSFTDLAFGGQADKFARTLCVKRSEFSHEAEIRLLFQDIHKNQSNDGLAFFKFNCANILDEIAFDPRLSQEEVNSLRSEFQQLGWKGPMIQSDLYEMPSTVIQL